MKKLVVLSGAGISAESGIKTFRDMNGLWENHNVMDVASPEGWQRDMKLVLDFYNQRRRELKNVEPNAAHIFFSELEKDYEVTIITQNVDNLHERSGSKNIIHLHGILTQAKSSYEDNYIENIEYKDINIGDMAEDGSQLRPHIVWFGEAVPMIEKAAEICAQADIIVIIGTSLQVYPAASLMNFAKDSCKIFIIDPSETITNSHYTFIKEKAVTGVKILKEKLQQM